MEPATVNPGWRKSSYSSNSGAVSCVEIGSIPWRKSSHSSQSGATSCVEVGAIPWRKASHSSQSGAGSCVEVGVVPWRKSSHSSQSGGSSCVEAGHAAGAILIRDTTDNGKGLTLRVTPTAWTHFTTRIRANRVLS